jgi:hypothetical protein
MVGCHCEQWQKPCKQTRSDHRSSDPLTEAMFASLKSIAGRFPVALVLRYSMKCPAPLG